MTEQPGESGLSDSRGRLSLQDALRSVGFAHMTGLDRASVVQNGRRETGHGKPVPFVQLRCNLIYDSEVLGSPKIGSTVEVARGIKHGRRVGRVTVAGVAEVIEIGFVPYSIDLG